MVLCQLLRPGLELLVLLLMLQRIKSLLELLLEYLLDLRLLEVALVHKLHHLLLERGLLGLDGSEFGVKPLRVLLQTLKLALEPGVKFFEVS